MEHTLKITNVLADPTRFHIYEFITRQHGEVTVQDIAEAFKIHPNVARLHLSKLEDVNLLVSDTNKSGKGGRPSRIYKLSDDVVQLSFPYRDYQMLANIALQTMMTLGEPGEKALYETGKRFGVELMEKQMLIPSHSINELTFQHKFSLLRETAAYCGFHPDFEHNGEESKIYFKIFNCPFKELASQNSKLVCGMHTAFIRGLFEVLFTDVELIEKDNITNGCASCTYHVSVTN